MRGLVSSSASLLEELILPGACAVPMGSSWCFRHFFWKMLLGSGGVSVLLEPFPAQARGSAQDQGHVQHLQQSCRKSRGQGHCRQALRGVLCAPAWDTLAQGDPAIAGFRASTGQGRVGTQAMGTVSLSGTAQAGWGAQDRPSLPSAESALSAAPRNRPALLR